MNDEDSLWQRLKAAYPMSSLPFFLRNIIQILSSGTVCQAKKFCFLASLAIRGVFNENLGGSHQLVFSETLFKGDWLRWEKSLSGPLSFPFYFSKMQTSQLELWQPRCDPEDGNKMLKTAEQKLKSAWAWYDLMEPPCQPQAGRLMTVSQERKKRFHLFKPL